MEMLPAERSRCNAVWNGRRSATCSTLWPSAQLQSVHKHGTSSVISLQSVRHSKVPLESVGPLRQQQTSSACIAQKPESSMAKEPWSAVDCVASCRNHDVTNNSTLAASVSVGSLRLHNGVADESQPALVAQHNTGCPHSRPDNHQPHNIDSTSCSTLALWAAWSSTVLAAQNNCSTAECNWQSVARTSVPPRDACSIAVTPVVHRHGNFS